jgi:hypothetical protein
VSAITGTNPNTMTLTAYYGFEVIGLTGPIMLTGKTTVPLD